MLIMLCLIGVNCHLLFLNELFPCFMYFKLNLFNDVDNDAKGSDQNIKGL